MAKLSVSLFYFLLFSTILCDVLAANGSSSIASTQEEQFMEASNNEGDETEVVDPSNVKLQESHCEHKPADVDTVSNNSCNCTTETDNKSCKCTMFFNNSINTVIAFDFWETTTIGEYIVSIVLLFFLSVLAVCIKSTRESYKNYILTKSGICVMISNHIPIFLLAIVTYAFDFFLMLVVMTFNLGIFVTICGGYAFGYTFCTFTLAPLVKGNKEKLSEAHMDCC